MTEAQQFVTGLQTGQLPQCDRCGHHTFMRPLVSGQFICPDCEHKLTITPPRKQPYVKVRMKAYSDSLEKGREVVVMLENIALICGPHPDANENAEACVIVEGQSISVHPDDYPALVAAFEAYHA